MPEAILSTVNLTKRFGKRLAVDQLSLEIPAGEIFGFLGPNGSGKSTTIRMMLSLIHPDAGDVYCFGQPVSKSYPGYLKNIGALVEGADFYGNLSALTNLKMLARMGSGVDEQRCLEVLRLVDLESRKDDQVKTFSHGMRQRLGIAQAILHRPKLLILDEPSTGLDPQGMVEMRRMIQALVRDEGMTVFLSSHMLNEVEQICTSLAVLDEGRLLVSGPVDQYLSAESATLTELQATPAEKARKILGALEFVTDLEESNGGFRFHTPHARRPQVIQALTEGSVEIFSMNPVSNLEDYFLSLFGAREISVL